ncbi:MAG: hypothetical protein ACKVP7_22540 [Hyphomicrobiaceae bacterium]
MKHPILAACVAVALLWVPAAMAQGATGAVPGRQPDQTLPGQPPPGPNDSGARQRPGGGEEPRGGEQGQEEQGSPQPDGGCQYRQRRLELIV